MSDFLLRRFETEGAATWAPHAPATRELRRAPGRGRGAAASLTLAR